MLRRSHATSSEEAGTEELEAHGMDNDMHRCRSVSVSFVVYVEMKKDGCKFVVLASEGVLYGQPRSAPLVLRLKFAAKCFRLVGRSGFS